MLFTSDNCKMLSNVRNVHYMTDDMIYYSHFLFPIADLKIFSLCNVIQQKNKVWPKRNNEVCDNKVVSDSTNKFDRSTSQEFT